MHWLNLDEETEREHHKIAVEQEGKMNPLQNEK